jgi:hypothetical protein
MTTQLKAVHLTSSGSVWGEPGRVRDIYFVASGTAGTITLKDGGSGGTTIAVIDTPALATWGQYMKLTGMGLRFNTSIYAALSNVTGATFFIG